MHFNRFTHLNDTHAVQNSGILQFSEIRPQSLCNIIIPWSIKYMWFNAAHSLLILTMPNCSLIRRHFPVWCGGRCTAPGGVGLRTMYRRLRAASGRCPDGSGRRPDGSRRLRTAFSRNGPMKIGLHVKINVIFDTVTSRRSYVKPKLKRDSKIGSPILDGVKTLRTQDTSDPRHFGTSAEVSTSAPVPNCPDISALVPKCLGTLWLFGTKEDTSALRYKVHWMAGWMNALVIRWIRLIKHSVVAYTNSNT